MKNLITVIVLLSAGSMGIAGNAGGGGTGKKVAVFYSSMDYDIVNFKMRYCDEYGKWRMSDISMPLKGIDPRYLKAIKVSFRNRAWASVEEFTGVSFDGDLSKF